MLEDHFFATETQPANQVEKQEMYFSLWEFFVLGFFGFFVFAGVVFLFLNLPWMLEQIVDPWKGLSKG